MPARTFTRWWLASLTAIVVWAAFITVGASSASANAPASPAVPQLKVTVGGVCAGHSGRFYPIIHVVADGTGLKSGGLPLVVRITDLHNVNATVVGLPDAQGNLHISANAESTSTGFGAGDAYTWQLRDRSDTVVLHGTVTVAAGVNCSTPAASGSVTRVCSTGVVSGTVAATGLGVKNSDYYLLYRTTTSEFPKRIATGVTDSRGAVKFTFSFSGVPASAASFKLDIFSVRTDDIEFGGVVVTVTNSCSTSQAPTPTTTPAFPVQATTGGTGTPWFAQPGILVLLGLMLMLGAGVLGRDKVRAALVRGH